MYGFTVDYSKTEDLLTEFKSLPEDEQKQIYQYETVMQLTNAAQAFQEENKEVKQIVTHQVIESAFWPVKPSVLLLETEKYWADLKSCFSKAQQKIIGDEYT